MKYKIGDEIIYGRHGICNIIEITERSFYDEAPLLYYVLKSEKDGGAVFYVPASNAAAVSKMRRVLTSQEIHEMIKDAPDADTQWSDKEILRRERFRNIISSGDRGKLVKLLKTLYYRSEEQKKQNKKLHMTDEKFLREIEKILYEEFSPSIRIKQEELIDFIINQE